MPTNIVLDAIHTRRGVKWGVPAMLLAVRYILAAALCTGLTDAGRSGWLNILAALLLWRKPASQQKHAKPGLRRPVTATATGTAREPLGLGL